MIEKLQAGQFPIKTTATQDMFVRHTQSMPERIEVVGHGLVESGHVSITRGTAINLFALCQASGPKVLDLLEIAYIDDGDNLKVSCLKKLAKVELHNPSYATDANTAYPIVYGFTTKLCNLRWGFIIKLNPKTGDCLIEVDKESPIVGVKVRLY